LKLYWHSQGLSDKSKHPYKGYWPHGRGWLYIGEPGYNTTKKIGVEWRFGSKRCALSLDLNHVDGDRGVMLQIAIPWLVALYITLDGFIPAGPDGWLPGHWADSSIKPGEKFWYPEQRTIGIRIFDKMIWISLWQNEMEWRSDQPWWWEFTIHPIDVLLGDEKHSSRDIATGDMRVWMPEGVYSATYRTYESTWKRPRWPWVKRAIRTDIDLQQAIPFSGKGENSWDLDEDGLEGFTATTANLHEAQRQVRESVLRTRRSRGDPERWPVAPQLQATV